MLMDNNRFKPKLKLTNLFILNLINICLLQLVSIKENIILILIIFDYFLRATGYPSSAQSKLIIIIKYYICPSSAPSLK